jgi:predicted transcriptional regulator
LPELTNAERFLNAFNTIEMVLRSRTANANKSAGFSELVSNSKDLTASQKTRLKDLAMLRNTIVHSPLDEKGEIYADPRKSTVEWIELQAETIERPPRVISALKLQPPKMLSGEDEIHIFLNDVVIPHQFSQSPYFRKDGTIGLITTNTVARWIASQYQPNQGLLLESSSIEEVSVFSELIDAHVLKSADLKVVDAIKIFSGSDGNPPAAIVITHSGKNTEKPLGICTSSDLNQLYRSIGL